MINPESTIVATDQQVSSQLDDEAVILNLDNGVYYGLDPVGAHIWTLIQEPRRVGDLVGMLMNEYEVEAEQCTDEVVKLLNVMEDQGLVKCI